MAINRAADPVDRVRSIGARLRQVFSKDDDLSAGMPERPRILVVEDDYLVAAELEEALIEAGFDVVGVAMTADEAVGLAKSEQPSLAVVDVRLAGDSDGVDAAIAMFRDHGIRVIFATAHDDPHTRRRAEPAMPLAWLAKPYNAKRLIPLIRDALGSKT